MARQVFFRPSSPPRSKPIPHRTGWTRHLSRRTARRVPRWISIARRLSSGIRHRRIGGRGIEGSILARRRPLLSGIAGCQASIPHGSGISPGSGGVHGVGSGHVRLRVSHADGEVRGGVGRRGGSGNAAAEGSRLRGRLPGDCGRVRMHGVRRRIHEGEVACDAEERQSAGRVVGDASQSRLHDVVEPENERCDQGGCVPRFCEEIRSGSISREGEWGSRCSVLGE
mmetsp:Transcript_18897/g.28688  ORF Transcript_18897/g.28688 Transcript_18897/m.28688 type:complete len:226 (+) Transcript_18897:363-1040(+)